MPEPDRLVAGFRCRDVLAQLSDYLDGELAAERIAQIEAHLAGCDWCERFGGRFAAVVRAFRAGLTVPPPLESAVAERLHAGLDRGLAAPGLPLSGAD
jgi:anti-sigma factor RsiW